MLTVIALTADILKISTTAGAEFADVASAVGLKTGVWHVDNLGSNLIAVGLLGAIGLAAGSVGSILNRPWGPGLLGGSGLSVLGTAALTIGLVEFPVRAAEILLQVRLVSSPSRSREILVTGHCSLRRCWAHRILRINE